MQNEKIIGREEKIKETGINLLIVIFVPILVHFIGALAAPDVKLREFFR